MTIKKTEGAFYTGKYRNVFKEFDYSETEINERVRDTWDKLFCGNENTRIYILQVIMKPIYWTREI